MALTYYADEDSEDEDLIAGLRRVGLDIVSAGEVGNRGRPDEWQLDFATSVNRAIFTSNVADFSRIHRDWLGETRSHAGMVLIRQRQYSIGERVRRLRLIADSLSAEQMRDRCEFLSSWA